MSFWTSNQETFLSTSIKGNGVIGMVALLVLFLSICYSKFEHEGNYGR